MKSIAQIAAELQGYDPQALSAADVSRFLSQLVEPVQDVMELPLFEALGRVLAADVVSPFDVPPHDNSAMDGYAFAGAQLAAGTALTLKVVGTALAGKAWQGMVGAGECVKIMTGAIMPSGLDTVVPQEFVNVQADTVTLPAQLLQPGDNRRLRGEDLMQGRPALLKGELLTPARLGLAASLGLKTVRTWRPLRVAYFSTGDEILSLGEAPREGAVYDSNRYTVFGMLRRLGCEVIDMGVVRDDPALLEAAFTRAAAQADAIITSGGVSVGEADYTKAMMKKLGDVAFWKIAMRPGRPMAVGRISQAKSASSPMDSGESSSQNNSNPNGDGRFADGPPPGETAPSGVKGAARRRLGVGSVGAILFGLPGNPVAVMVTFLAFVRPALLQMMGSTAPAAPLLRARSLEPMRKKPGRTEYQRGWVSTTADGSLQVKTTGNQGSGVLSSMAQANGLIVLHHAQGSVKAGEEVDVMMFEGVL
ncbi:MAG: molybdopterin molybdotransferase MoeA [Polaromonas sp.]|uniref:molybdopterin molybdotransferase MoeA n=1 Tax=Polaromonas sp. TaxID=1869339 RepID=UPI00273106C7|nr:molybdopterin molybdotransferase MoeA [Polaromonas sp.]MDP2451027.1 molybdopterin molybdotransferase MoeA [Polaromonas sp.]MDP3246541.1 molybdopterin molybdotransferase MoeA [Polaromonas sp.]